MLKFFLAPSVDLLFYGFVINGWGFGFVRTVDVD
jgi:hypothetical protein